MVMKKEMVTPNSDVIVLLYGSGRIERSVYSSSFCLLLVSCNTCLTDALLEL
jgi:hypothetical protein